VPDGSRIVRRVLTSILRGLVCLGALFAIVALNWWVLPINPTTAALAMLLLVLAAATKWGLAESIFTSMAGMLIFNFYFLPPIGTFTIADPQNWVALSAFLVTATTASQLSANARQRAEDALRRKAEIEKLYELSRVLLMDDGTDSVRHSVLRAGQVLQSGAITFFDAASNEVYGLEAAMQVSAGDMARVAETGEPLLSAGNSVVPVKMGTNVIGSLATDTGRLSAAVRDSVAGLLAINYERARALRRAAAAELARRNEEFKSSLLDGLAHDLKTPLTAIRTCVTRLIELPPRTEEVRQELLSIIDQESIRLQKTITEAVELARIESRALHLELQATSVAEIVELALGEVRDENRARYSVEAAADIHVMADGGLLRRALLQILENARKYSPPDSPIRIEVREEDESAVITVLDSGQGVPPDELDRIFEKFYRGQRRRDGTDGTGMGLAIARGIIEAHGGRIMAENRAGGGLAVVVTLPLIP